MVLTIQSVRRFSTTKRLQQYSLAKHKQTFGQGKRLETLNRIEEGMNEYNTDVTKPYGKKELEVFKPIQHPRKLHD